jgi:8-oxo-dGTP pyrophosphatase MutT (NUDIX family)
MAPSGSGSADWRDDILSSSAGFTQLVAGEMERELREELGLSHSVRCQSIVVGYCRMLDRAGKPEYFGLTRVFGRLTLFAVAYLNDCLSNGMFDWRRLLEKSQFN